jgi:hypothetical protein
VPRERIEYWKQIASIQIHFNDMCIRTRWLGLTAVATGCRGRDSGKGKHQVSLAV